MADPINIFWFRRDLRHFDNHGFFKALSNDLPVVPLFIFDTEILDDLNDRYDKRVNFIYHKLNELNQTFIDQNSSLLIKKGKPSDVFKELISSYEIKKVYINHDYEPYGIKRDEEISDLLFRNGISLDSFKDHVVFEKEEIIKSDGNPYSIFTPYSKAWKSKFGKKELTYYHSEEHLHNLYPYKFDFPVLEEIGFKPSWVDYPDDKPSKQIISNYHRYRDYPSKQGTTRIGVHLRFGTVSPRQMIKLADELNESWLNELIWREFYMMILYHNPYVVKLEYKPKYRLMPWRTSEADFERWKNGLTGYPIVDAGMRELNQTGYMHNRVRMITASFLTKHLLIDWRWGEAWFAKKLLDYELSSNNGNWQWAASSGCDAAPYFRIFNPTTQARKFDPDMEYIRKWVNELDSFDYPKAMVKHKEARNRAIQTFKHTLNTVE
ncbi:MAG: DNA photolyase family protein [Bacteroidales bacterium]|nr:DNA photolyase family protein [Bacteroidales bacterium]